jgi:hypothetical protein
MPWSLSQRDGKWCVVKDSDGEVEGCHDSRADAIKQQRALYANERRVAALYEELDAQEVEVIEPEEPRHVTPNASELVKIEIGKENEALTASLLERMEAMDLRAAETQQALVAALHAIGTRNPVVNVAAPEVSVEAPNVTVEPPAVTIEAPEVTVEAPNVTVEPQIHLPSTQKTVTFERDPLSGQVTQARVQEE